MLVEEKLIEAVRKHPELYDTNNPSYMKAILKTRIWTHIAMELNLKDANLNSSSKVLNSVLISFSLQDSRNDTVNTVKTFRTRKSTVGNGENVRVLLKHNISAKGPRDSIVRRNLHPGEEVTAVLGSARCVFWNVNLGQDGLWDESGCRVEASDNAHTLCVCSHLSTFAVLMDLHDYVGKDAALEVLSWACTGASVVCLLLTLIVFHGCRNIQSERTSIGKNLCVCLVTAHLLALVFLDKSYVNFTEVECSLIAGLLHYLFLASFCWMSVEGHHLYRLVVRVFDTGHDFRCWYFLVGYGIPAVIVLFTKLVALVRNEKAYGRDELCWLSSPFYIWSFIGPVLFLTTMNTAVLILALREAVSAGLSQGKSKRETVWIWIRGWFSLSALLGVTWVFGLAYMEFDHSFVYIFVVLNGCQGVFIFLFRCVLCEQVRSTVVSRVRKDGFIILFRGFTYRRSSHPSDGGHNTSMTATTGHNEGEDSHPLWYVLTHRQLEEAVNSCDLLQLHVQENGSSGGVVSIRDQDNSDVSRESKGSRMTCNLNEIPEYQNATEIEAASPVHNATNCAITNRPIRSARHVSVTRYPTIDEESDPDC